MTDQDIIRLINPKKLPHKDMLSTYQAFILLAEDPQYKKLWSLRSAIRMACTSWNAGDEIGRERKERQLLNAGFTQIGESFWVAPEM